MKKLLLLGGGGYIGSKFYSLYNTNYNIKSIDLELFNTDSYSVNINYDKLTNINDYDIIICFAGHSSVAMCEYSPQRSWINNVEYFKNLCNKINNHQLLIYMSTASVYGNSDKIAKEDSSINLNPIQNYDLQKIIIDIIANKYISEGKNIIGLRLGTVNGSSPHTRKELMLNSMVSNALENNVITIKNLNMKRSILSIDDLMRALETIILSNSPIYGQYNLCSFTMNVKELADSVSKLCNAKIHEQPSDNIFYSFEMAVDKFCTNFNFVFRETTESIINSLIDNHKHTTYSVRDNDAKFQYCM